MKQLVIAFFHMGLSGYQKYTLDLAVKNNPDAKVILLTNEPGAQYPPGVEVVNIEQYDGMIRDLEIIYLHKTTCEYPFEFRGIIRWLVYNEWWKAHPEYNLFVADSDVMIFSDLTKEQEKWSKYSHTLSMRTAGGQSFWFDMSSMQSLVDLIWYVYKNKNSESAELVFGHYDKLQKEGLPGGVCDMTFLAAHAETIKLLIGETTDIIGGGEINGEASTYDHNILMSQGYEYDNGRKVITWKGGQPYCRTTGGPISFPVRFHTLHMSCSGGMIEGYYNNGMGYAK